MADNYLERRMEEHRAGRDNYRARRLTPSGQRPGKLTLDFPSRRVYVVGMPQAVIRQMCEVGCRTAFCSTDIETGTALARAVGAQFHPIDAADAAALDASLARVARAWGDIDILINADHRPAPLLAAARWLIAHRSQQPIANPYGRVIDIASTDLCAVLQPELRDCNVAISAVYTDGCTPEADIARLCLFLTMTSASYRITAI